MGGGGGGESHTNVTLSLTFVVYFDQCLGAANSIFLPVFECEATKRWSKYIINVRIKSAILV